MKLRFENAPQAHPVEIEMEWDGDDFVVWVRMECSSSEVDHACEFGIGGFNLTGMDVKAVSNFQLTEAQVRQWRDALSEMLDA